jgi:hypothetical protein
VPAPSERPTRIAPRPAGFGGKGIRTPDFQLAKLALYQLSYAPFVNADSRMRNVECNHAGEIAASEIFFKGKRYRLRQMVAAVTYHLSHIVVVDDPVRIYVGSEV